MLETMMNFIKLNWMDILIIAILFVVFVLFLVALWRKGKKQMVINIINGLVARAEKMYGSGTGPVKLFAVWCDIYNILPWYIRAVFPREELEGYIEDGVKWLDKQLEKQGISLLGYDDEYDYGVDVEVGGGADDQ